jgi:hypothetical protein
MTPPDVSEHTTLSCLWECKMTHVDNDAAVRDRAYILWELAGRPIGQEHEFWARASREIEGGPEKDTGSETAAEHVEIGPEDESREDLKGDRSAAQKDKDDLQAATAALDK